MALTGQAKTDYQREYMRRHRRAKLERSAGLVRSKRLPEDQQAEPPEQQDQELIERLMQVTRECDQLRKELEFVTHRGAEPRSVGPDHPSRCSVCRKRRDQVKAMFTNPRPHDQKSLRHREIARRERLQAGRAASL
jgi:hypothetical protein